MATLVGSSSGEPSSAAAQQQQYDDETPLFTCLSCSIAFPNPEDQRVHYRSDLHRYNMKRRVANLPPVKADVFNAKILERRAALAQEQQSSTTVDKCDACDKRFASQNAFRDHLNSKKHKENVVKLENRQNKAAAATASTSSAPAASATAAAADGDVPLVFRIPKPAADATSTDTSATETVQESLEQTADEKRAAAAEKRKNAREALMVGEDATDEQIQAAIDAKVAASRRIDPTKECIFCPASKFNGLEESLAHMSKAHGFFVPDSEYLVDLPGLVAYLADKVSIGNICLYCNGRGRGFHSAESVRKHMLDKFHCKIAYATQEDQLELSDFYDFTSSYPAGEAAGSDEEWEDEDVAGADADEDMEVDGEVVDKTTKAKASAKSQDASTAAGDNDDNNDQVRYGDNEFELVLPSGARLGHRSMRRYYAQTLWQTPAGHAQQQQLEEEEEMSRRYGGGGALARRLIAESGMGHHTADGTIVQGRHGQLIKARNKGEAKEAKRHINEFRDRNFREQHMTKIGFRNNNQKHFRDPLLQ
ncbi:hypothetical protein BCV70DRAFT_201627 [Testicularia cyperi]|uniref:C2H2-type domain-containing protein n=1 Tax=Testicularia cyperi TaxID=1882483 RepID=A0A317XKJ5_9BASI|nr:hypothetical protein BCV70DRAFT_201627 [Testicularia cyperi]